MIRVEVADDQPLVCVALRTLIAGEDDIELVAEAGDGVAALGRRHEGTTRRRAHGHPHANATSG